MFVQVVEQEAMKTFPKIQNIIEQINQCLSDTSSFNQLQNDIPIIEKSLDSYKSDLQKSLANSHQYYTKLIPEANLLKADLELIDNALQKINQFS